MKQIAVSVSMVLAASSALAAVGNRVVIDQSPAAMDDDVIKRIGAAVDNRLAAQTFANQSAKLAEILSDGDITLREKYVNTPLLQLAWSGGQQDSTDASAMVAGFCYSNCYSNCYSDCHGSRGWR